MSEKRGVRKEEEGGEKNKLGIYDKNQKEICMYIFICMYLKLRRQEIPIDASFVGVEDPPSVAIDEMLDAEEGVRVVVRVGATVVAVLFTR